MQGSLKTKPEYSIVLNKDEITSLMKALKNANYHHEDFLKKNKNLQADIVSHHKSQIENNEKMSNELSNILKL